MVGNDVIDLGDREAQPESRHPRFDSRVFTADEYRLIEASRCSNQVRWMLWACKESAYKLVKRQDPATVFSPRTFEVEMVFPGPVQVHHQGGAVCVRINLHGDAIHAVATRNRDDTKRLISAVGTTVSNPSSAVRELARQHLSRVLGCTPGDIEIASGSDRIPELRIGGSRPPGSISLSHHGRFVAFSCWFMSRVGGSPA
jgi:phosphopantetheinyl transferase (holo-ACP synthase)